MSHDVVLSSYYCRDEFPNNHGCEFTNVLNQPLDIDAPNESWAVALREIIYEPEFWPNVREGFTECQIQLGRFNCYLSDYRMIQAMHLYLDGDTQFPTDPNEPFTTKAMLWYNKYEGLPLLVEEFEVTKPNSFDIFGNPIDWSKLFRMYVRHNKFPNWKRGFFYKSHYGFLIVDTSRMKQLWDASEKTEQEKNLIFADHVAG